MTTMSSASPRPPCGVNGELDVHLKSTPMGRFPHLSQTEIQSQRVPVGHHPPTLARNSIRSTAVSVASSRPLINVPPMTIWRGEQEDGKGGTGVRRDGYVWGRDAVQDYRYG